MREKQPKTRKSVSAQYLNQVKPMNDENYFQNTRNQSFHYPSSTEKMKFSSSSQSTTVSWTSDKKKRCHHQTQDFVPEKNLNDSKRIERLENCLILIGSLFTILTLAVFLISIYLYMMINETQVTTTTTTFASQIQSNQTNSSVTANQPYYCSGVSPYTLWTLYATVGIQMAIDTRNCSFPTTPLYFTSLGGNANHFAIGGYTAIYAPTNISFSVYTLPLDTYANTAMLSDSQTYHWNLNWVGISD